MARGQSGLPILLAPSALAARVAAANSEFRVNTCTTLRQRRPAVATDAAARND